MAKRSFANWSWTPTAVANAATMTANGACFLQGAGAAQRFLISEISISGLATVTSPLQMMLARDSTVAVTTITLGTNGSDAPMDPQTTSTAQTTGFSATTMPQRNAALQLLSLGLNAQGGIYRWNAPIGVGAEIVVFGTAINVGEVSLSVNTGGTPGLIESHIIYEAA